MASRSEITKEIQCKLEELSNFYKIEISELLLPCDAKHRESLDAVIVHIFTKFYGSSYTHVIIDTISTITGMEKSIVAEIIEFRLSQREIINSNSKMIIPDLTENVNPHNEQSLFYKPKF
jgi:endonuclease III-like uncharacterized protein